MELSGDKKLLKKLERLKNRELNKGISKATRGGAKIIQQAIKEQSPRDSGDLAKSYKTRALKRSRTRKGHEVKTTLPYAGHLEHGTEDIPAQEHTKEAAEQVADRALDFAAETIKAEIERITNL